ncbi:uncharacterized protein [Asterias amurensis]|uniref:uncharacterized protein n=1 Tax=Asterias amurensis TaxID=7602 RepID=UPI003AB71278
MPTSHSPTFRVTMSDNNSATLPVVTLSVDPVSLVSPETCPSTHPKTKRTLLSTLKNSPSMLRRRIKPPAHLNNSSRDSWDGGVSTGTSGSHHTGSESTFTGKEFHVRYQGRTRVTTLQVSEAVNAVKKLAPDLTALSSSSSPASSSTEDLLAASSPSGGQRSSSPSLSSSPSPSNLSTSSPQLLRPSSPTNLATPKSPRPKSTSKSFFKSCCLSITKRCVVIDDDEKLVNETIPIATVAYCATDLRYPRAVALICKTYSSVLICHVFVCSSKEKAEKIVAFIGKAFESAWHDWKCINDPSSLGAPNNNNYEQLFRGRAVSCDIKNRGVSKSNDKLNVRHSSYETRNGVSFDFSSPEDEY